MNAVHKIYISLYLEIFIVITIGISLLFEIYAHYFPAARIILTLLLIMQLIIIQFIYDIEEEYYHLLNNIKKLQRKINMKYGGKKE